MEKKMRAVKIALMVGLIMMMTSPAFARTISMKEGGTALWIFLIIGSLIVLLQVIPATILFFSFIGTMTTMGFKKGKKIEDEVYVPEIEPVRARK